jgi:hypothetical protein
MHFNKGLYALATVVIIAVLATLFFNPFEKSEARTATVADWEWIDTPQGSCGIEYGGRLTEIGAAGSIVKVRYTSPDGYSPGTSCDGDEVFTLESKKFEAMTADYEAKKRFFAENDRVVNQLQNNSVVSPRTQLAFNLGWVDTEPVSSERNRCVAADGGHLTEIGIHDSRILISYTAPKWSGTAGTLCDQGVMFFVDASQFTAMTAQYEAKVQELTANRLFVDELLAHPIHSPRIHKVMDWQWVDIEPQSLERNRCGIEKDGLLTEIGVNGTRVLVRYSAPHGASTGTPCDGGEVFFVDAAQF